MRLELPDVKHACSRVSRKCLGPGKWGWFATICDAVGIWVANHQSSIINQSLFNHHHGTSQHPILRKRPGIM
jgi:hypothetical protein